MEDTASAAIGHVWFTDCESIFARLVSPTTKQVDHKRLAIDLSALKQLIWDNRDDCDEEVDGSKGDFRGHSLDFCVLRAPSPHPSAWAEVWWDSTRAILGLLGTE